MTTPVFVVVDTDDEFQQRLEQHLSTLEENYTVKNIIPKVTLPSKSMSGNVTEQVRENYPDTQTIAAFFVDLVVHNTNNRDGFSSSGQSPSTYNTEGIQIARALRNEYQQTPIFIITDKISFTSEQSLLSEASLEDIDGVFIKHYISGKGFSSEILELILKKASIKRQRAMPVVRHAGARASSGTLANVAPENVSITGSHEAFYTALKECGSQLWSLLTLLLGKEHKLIEALQPGRSGAVVFKVTTKHVLSGGSKTEPRNWIVKVAHDGALIEKETSNYQDVIKMQLDRASYPQLLATTPLNSNGLSGIALGFEGNASSLRDHFKKIRGKSSDTVQLAKCFTTTLGNLYSSTDPVSESGLWNHYWKHDGDLRAKLVDYLKEMEGLANEVQISSEYQIVCEFVMTNGSSCIEISQQSVEQFQTRWIHGDLNSGNVLVYADSPNGIILIDFASAHRGHIAKDFTKLERDIYFRILDEAGTKGSCDWDRLQVWKKLASIAAGQTALASEELADNEKALLAFIRELRSGLVRINPEVKFREYLVGLICYSLTAVLIPDMSLPKKMFGIWYVAELLKQAKQSSPTDLLKDWANPTQL